MFDPNLAQMRATEHRRVNVIKKKSSKKHRNKEEDAEDTPVSNFFYPPNQEVVMAGGFSDVRVLITDKGTQRKWSDTRMNGILKLVKVQDVGAPIVNIRMHGVDSSGKERNIILEYELPVNFKL